MARYPLVFTATVYICGIVVGNSIRTFPVDLWILTASLIFLCFIPSTKSMYILSIALLAAGSLRLHMQRDLVPENHIAFFHTDSIRNMTGVITESHTAEDMANQYILNLESICGDSAEVAVRGKIIIFARKHSRVLSYGDRVRVAGKLEKIPVVRNPGQFDYHQFLAAKGIYHRCYWNDPDAVSIIEKTGGSPWQMFIIQPIIHYSQDTFRRCLSRASAALVNALLLGEKQDLAREKISVFQKVGVVHVLAISGLHVGFIVLFCMTGFSLLRVRSNLRFWLLLAALLLYGAVVQFKPPVVRASLMAVFYLYAEVLQRKPVTDNLLAGAALIILLINPLELYNPGFQFSFVAVAAILHGAVQFDQWIPVRKWIEKRFKSNFPVTLTVNLIWLPLLVSLSAIIGTLPLTAYYYGMIPVVALIANIIVIPLVAVIVMLTLFMLILKPLSGFLAGGVGELIDLVHNILGWIVDAFGALPFAAVHVPHPPFAIVILLIFAFFCLLQVQSYRARKIFALLCFSIFFLLLAPGFKDDRSIQLTFLDVGQGDAAHIRFPDGNTMLIDAGATNKQWDNGRMSILPFLKQSGNLRLTYMVASHAHDDHIGGMLTLLNEIKLDTMVLSAYPYRSKRFSDLQAACSDRNIPMLVVGRGDRINADPSCRIYVLHPDSACSSAKNLNGSECNNSSLVIKIQYGENGVLFTGDLEKSVESRVTMYGALLESEILKVAHHGSNTSTSDEFLGHINPVIAVIPVALKNKFSHPSPKTLERLANHHLKVYRTSHTGAVMFRIYPEYIEKINWRVK